MKLCTKTVSMKVQIWIYLSRLTLVMRFLRKLLNVLDNDICNSFQVNFIWITIYKEENVFPQALILTKDD
jgi:hypothetical protein